MHTLRKWKEEDKEFGGSLTTWHSTSTIKEAQSPCILFSTTWPHIASHLPFHILIKNFILICFVLCVQGHTCLSLDTEVRGQHVRLKMVFSFYYMDPGAQTQVIRLSGKRHYSLSHFVGLMHTFLLAISCKLCEVSHWDLLWSIQHGQLWVICVLECSLLPSCE